MSLGKNIKEARLAQGLTQEQLATKLNLTKDNISKYESDSLEPSSQTLRSISQILKVSLDDLLDNDTDHFIPQLTSNDERDIARELDDILSGMNNDSMMFDGEPFDEDTKEILRASLENDLRMARLIAKQKFTPKKYRK